MSIDSVELSCDEFGNPGRWPVIILHGFFASARNWRGIATRLAQKYHVYVLNMRNHGSSPRHPEMDYPTMAADILAFMDDRGLQRATLLGHSMGGKAAMWFALVHPERIDQLLIADIAPVNYQHRFDRTIRALLDLPLDRINNRKQAEAILADAVPDLSYRRFLLQNLALSDGKYFWKVDLEIFQQSAPAIVAFPDVQGVAPYRGDVLFMTGSDSKFIVPDHVDAVNALFPKAQLETIPDAGHWLHVDAPAVFTTLVEDYVQ